jgi:hypothetical protein
VSARIAAPALSTIRMRTSRRSALNSKSAVRVVDPVAVSGGAGVGASGALRAAMVAAIEKDQIDGFCLSSPTSDQAI